MKKVFNAKTLTLLLLLTASQSCKSNFTGAVNDNAISANNPHAKNAAGQLALEASKNYDQVGMVVYMPANHRCLKYSKTLEEAAERWSETFGFDINTKAIVLVDPLAKKTTADVYIGGKLAFENQDTESFEGQQEIAKEQITQEDEYRANVQAEREHPMYYIETENDAGSEEHVYVVVRHLGGHEAGRESGSSSAIEGYIEKNIFEQYGMKIIAVTDYSDFNNVHAKTTYSVYNADGSIALDPKGNPLYKDKRSKWNANTGWLGREYKRDQKQQIKDQTAQERLELIKGNN